MNVSSSSRRVAKITSNTHTTSISINKMVLAERCFLTDCSHSTNSRLYQWLGWRWRCGSLGMQCLIACWIMISSVYVNLVLSKRQRERIPSHSPNHGSLRMMNNKHSRPTKVGRSEEHT